jgi:antitoxin MazE
MKTYLIQIGNSKGIRIPKSFIEQYKLSEEIELVPSAKGLLITSKIKPRGNWEDLFKNSGAVENLKENTEWQKISNRFDNEEWSW